MRDEDSELNQPGPLFTQTGTEVATGDSSAADGAVEQASGEAQDCTEMQAPAPVSPVGKAPDGHPPAEKTGTRRWAVYTFRDPDGTVLYVGQSMRLAERMSSHKREKEWWPEIETIEVDHVGSKNDACVLEKQLIEKFDPLHNIALKPKGDDKPGYPQCPECGNEALEIILPVELVAEPMQFQDDNLVPWPDVRWRTDSRPYLYCPRCCDDLTNYGVADGKRMHPVRLPLAQWFIRQAEK